MAQSRYGVAGVIDGRRVVVLLVVVVAVVLVRDQSEFGAAAGVAAVAPYAFAVTR